MICIVACLMVIAPMVAILATLLFRGKGHPEAARLAAFGSGCVVVWGPLATVGILIADNTEWPAVGALLGLVGLAVLVVGNALLASAASRPSLEARGPPSRRIYEVGSAISGIGMVALAAMAFHGWSGSPDDWMIATLLLPTLVLWTIGPLWLGGAGVGLALIHALVAPRLFDETEER